MSNEVREYIQDLSRLSKVYVGAPIQKSKYEEILTKLRKAYRLDRKTFSEEDINSINKIKKRIADYFKHYLETQPISQTSNYFQEEKYTEAKDYAKFKPYVVPTKSVIFHKSDYFIGTIIDWNAVSRLYQVISFTGDCKWYRETSLMVIGTSSMETYSRETFRVTHCWSCKEFLVPGDKECRYCGWYKCPSCSACGCNY